jgi:hypothetical protein
VLPAGPPNPCADAELPVGSPSPHFYPPLQSSFRNFRGRVVIYPAAADDAAANAAGLALLASENALNSSAAEGIQAPVGSPTSPVTVASWGYRTPQGFATVFRYWGVSVINHDDEAAALTFQIQDGPNSGTNPPRPGLSGERADTLEPTMVLVPDNKSITWRLANRDASAPILVELSYFAWTIPAKFKGTLASLTRQGNLGWGPCR